MAKACRYRCHCFRRHRWKSSSLTFSCYSHKNISFTGATHVRWNNYTHIH
jgi:hypothetical protein